MILLISGGEASDFEGSVADALECVWLPGRAVVTDRYGGCENAFNDSLIIGRV